MGRFFYGNQMVDCIPLVFAFDERKENVIYTYTHTYVFLILCAISIFKSAFM